MLRIEYLTQRRYHMVNLLGIIAIIGGFTVPFLTDGQVPATFFFWVGFLLLLWPNKHHPNISFWFKWARLGLAFNILGILFVTLILYTAAQTSFATNYILFLFLKGMSYLISPVSTVFELLIPYEQIKMPDGSFLFEISFLRSTVSSFLDILGCIVLGAMAGKVISLRSNERQRT